MVQLFLIEIVKSRMLIRDNKNENVHTERRKYIIKNKKQG